MFELHDRKHTVLISTIIFSLVFFSSSIVIWKVQDNFFKVENFVRKNKHKTETNFIDANLILGAAGVLSIMVTLLYCTIKYVTKAVTFSDEENESNQLVTTVCYWNKTLRYLYVFKI